MHSHFFEYSQEQNDAMHTMGKVVQKIRETMLWSSILLNLQLYNHSLLGYNHSQVIYL